jgi:hypothetical protein
MRLAVCPLQLGAVRMSSLRQRSSMQHLRQNYRDLPKVKTFEGCKITRLGDMYDKEVNKTSLDAGNASLEVVVQYQSFTDTHGETQPLNSRSCHACMMHPPGRVGKR